MSVLWSKWLISVIIVLNFASCTRAGQAYVKSSENTTCTANPCLTLNEYARQPALYFLNNTTFTFLAGTHDLDLQLNIENSSDVEFRAFDATHGGPVQVLLGHLVNITWTNCDGVKISDLVFALSGDTSIRSAFSALVFDKTTVLLSQLILSGNDTLQSTAIRAVSSQVTFNNVEVTEISGQSAAALHAFNSTIEFVGQNRFVNCTTWNGGTVTLQDSVSNFNGNTSFLQNTAIAGATSAAGALVCSNSIVLFNGTASFQQNHAELASLSLVSNSGGILIVSNTKLTFGRQSEVLFAKNSALLQGGAIRVSSSELVVQGRAAFESNSALLYGGAIHGEENSRIICRGEKVGSITFLNNSVQFHSGGAIDSLSSDIEIEKVHFEGNVAKFGGAVSSSSSKLQIKSCRFVRNHCAYTGGAMFVGESSVLFDGTNHFEQNRAKDSGAIYTLSSNVSFRGENYFSSNTAIITSGGVVLTLSNATIFGNSMFYNNQGFSGGGIYGIKSNVTIGGTSLFVNNAADIWGGGIMFSSGTLTMTGQASFAQNAVGNSGPALYAQHSNITISGNVSVSSGLTRKAGQIILEGAITLFNCTAMFIGSMEISNITAAEGSCIHAIDSEIDFHGCIHWHKNRALSNGGALYVKNSVVSLRSKSNCSTVQQNIASRLGGAIYAIDSSLLMSNSTNFIQNIAEYGGALAFDETSKLVLSEPLHANFANNHALISGGAIYRGDTYSLRECARLRENSNLNPLDCFVELRSTANLQLNFLNNTADSAGSVLYGGNLDKCRFYVGGGFIDDCGNRIGGNYMENATFLYENIFSIVSSDETTSDISSDPLRVCFCEGEQIICHDLNIETVRGKEFTVHAVVVGQNEGINPSSVSAYAINSVLTANHIQSTKKSCTPLRYRLTSNQNSSTLVLTADGPCKGGEISQRNVTVDFLPCPDAFSLQGSECVCESRLQRYTSNCSVDDDSIERTSTNTFWIGAIYDNGSYEGLILHPWCPFDYCVDTLVRVTLDNLDIQCNYNHSGTLCGSCKDTFSIALGTLHCLPCSNAYLALILPFSLAGIALVAIILLLGLTVAVGTLNGLIFYANVIQANSSVFFPHGKVNILTVFIAWLNLDLGIETCFYNGMNTYAFTWLQFIFPLYVWFLIGLIIVMSRFSDRIAGALGKNPVAALATLFLISYSKILRTVIVALSYTSLQYPNGSRKTVWLYDGNIPYFQNADHVILGVFALAVLLILFLPYTLLLLCGPCLQAASDLPIFSWINRIKPFLDAYYAPYKKETRYWVGTLLLVRCILLLTFAFNALGNASANLLAITSLTAGLAVLAWLHGRLYEKLYNDILEASFILNLCIFAAATYHVEEINGHRAELAYTSVGIAFVIFIFIVLFHVYQRVSKMSVWKKLPAKPKFLDKVMWKHLHEEAGYENRGFEANDDTIVSMQDFERVQSPTTTIVELREPMLEKYDD